MSVPITVKKMEEGEEEEKVRMRELVLLNPARGTLEF